MLKSWVNHTADCLPLYPGSVTAEMGTAKRQRKLKWGKQK